MEKRRIKNGYFQTALWCGILAILVFAPWIISGKGILTLVDDFNYQQIPFYIACNNAIKKGDILWSWSADLGTSFIGAYSFYTLGSPFFWMSLLVSGEMVPYIMGPLFVLKYIIAGITSYGYIKLFIKEEKYAVLGGVLYAFSGFTTAAMMYNHFHDVVALFPLMLIGLEKLVKDNRKYVFALTVALNALVNYVFFIGEVFFIIIYFLIRFVIPDFKKYIKKTISCLAEGILGVAMAFVLFLPSVLFVLDNPRVSESLKLSEMFIYPLERYLELIKAFFVSPDAMRAEVAIMEADFSTCEAWLPLFGCCLAMAFVCKYKKHWLSRMIIICFIMAFIPVLNSVFYMFNAEYYARWFYMPILLLALATVKMLEEKDYIWIGRTGLVAGAFTIFFALVLIWYGRVYHTYMFYGYMAISAAGYFWMWMYKKYSWRFVVLSISICICIVQFANIYQMKKEGQTAEFMMDTVIKTAEELDLPDSGNYRIQYRWPYWNGHLICDYPTAASFTSTVSGSIFEFYDLMDLYRKIVVRIPEEYVGIKNLLGIRYYIDTKDTGQPYIKKFNNGIQDVYIYEREDGISMGTSYDYYITEDVLRKIPSEKKHWILMKAIIVDRKDEKKVAETIEPLSEKDINILGTEYSKEDIRIRKAEEVTNFKRTTSGFSAFVSKDKESYVLFSIPYDKGWKAEINGKQTDIIKSGGFMAVKTEKGDSEIRFTYMTPGLILGCLISVAAWILWIILFVIDNRKRKRLTACRL